MHFRIAFVAALFAAFWVSHVNPSSAQDRPEIQFGQTVTTSLEKQQKVVKPATKKKPSTNAEKKAVARVEQDKAGIDARAGDQAPRGAAPLPGILSVFFGRAAEPPVAPQTSAFDRSLTEKGRKQFKVASQFEPQSVAYPSAHKRGTIVIDTRAKYLYLVEGPFSARRYGVAVGREGLLFTGTAAVGDMQEWPRWIPTKEMQEREPKKYGQYKDGMDGGPDNPLGARAIYLYQGKKDTYIRIHGTNQPETIGSASSNGCFRMVNEHVIDLYRRVKLGTQVVVL